MRYIVHDLYHCIKNVYNAWDYLKVIEHAIGENTDLRYMEERVNLQ